MNHKNNESGFTLIELLISIAIITSFFAILMNINNKLYKKIDWNLKINTAFNLIDDMKSEIDLYLNKFISGDYEGSRLEYENLSEYNFKNSPPKNILNQDIDGFKGYTRKIKIIPLTYKYKFNDKYKIIYLYKVMVTIFFQNKTLISENWLVERKKI